MTDTDDGRKKKKEKLLKKNYLLQTKIKRQ